MADASSDQVGVTEPNEDCAQEDGSSTMGGGPGAYGEKQAQDGVEFVILNDDVLTSVPNATMVLVDGSDLEKIAVLYQFPQFLEHCPSDSIAVMVPVICNNAIDWKEDLQMAAAEALYFVVNIPLPEVVVKQIIVCALAIIQRSSSGGEVFDACGEILSMMLPQVQRQDVLELIVPATTERATANTAESRRLAARIIGSLHDTMTADEIEIMFLSRSLDLAADKDASVRAMIAQSMAAVASKLPLRVAEKFLWPALRSLMDDSNARVRAAAIRAIARSAEAHKHHAMTSSMYRTLLLPMFLSECTKASEVASTDLRTVNDDTYLMLEIFAEIYGYFLSALSTLFKKDDIWTAALNTLRRMVTCNGPTVRHWCAFNMPAVASVCSDELTDKIKGVLQALSVDSDVETRATLAAGIHETTRWLSEGPLREEMIQAISDMMTDTNPQVRTNCIGHFSLLLSLLASSKEEPGRSEGIQECGCDAKMCRRPAEDKARDLAPILSSLEVTSVDSWRTQELLANQLKLSAHLIPQDMLCEHVAPLLFQMARESTYLVRRASMQALIHVVRHIADVRKRNHILKHFRVEWAHGKVYWTRLAYIDGTECAQKVFSWKLFVQLFEEELLLLTKDPVPNVRLRLVRLFPSLAPRWSKSPEFENALRTLTKDGDEQVAYEAQLQLRAMARTAAPTKEEEDRDKALEANEQIFFVQKPPRKNKLTIASAPDSIKEDGGMSDKQPDIGNGADANGLQLRNESASIEAGSTGQQHIGDTTIQETVAISENKAKEAGEGGAPGKTRESSNRQSASKKGLCSCFVCG